MIKRKVRLKEIREGKNETQVETARVLELSISQYQKIEQGIRGSSDSTKIKISKHFNLPVGYIFFNE